LDEDVSLHFVFVGVDDEAVVAFPAAFAFVVRIAVDNPLPGNPVIDFVDGIVLDIEYLVLFLVQIDIDGILCAVDGEVPFVLRGFPVVFRDLADLGGVDFPVGNVGGMFFVIEGAARVMQVHAVKMSACPMIFDGIDQAVLFLMKTIRKHFAWHDEGIILEVCREIIEQGSDAINRVGIQKRRC